jgi:hypothetical protein
VTFFFLAAPPSAFSACCCFCFCSSCQDSVPSHNSIKKTHHGPDLQHSDCMPPAVDFLLSVSNTRMTVAVCGAARAGVSGRTNEMAKPGKKFSNKRPKDTALNSTHKSKTDVNVRRCQQGRAYVSTKVTEEVGTRVSPRSFPITFLSARPASATRATYDT